MPAAAAPAAAVADLRIARIGTLQHWHSDG